MSVLRDPRVLQLLILTVFTISGQVYLNFQITPLQIMMTLVTTILLNWVFNYRKKGEIIIPYSALITGLGITLMLRADTLVPFILASMVAISSKYLIRYQGSHIFNPSNIGIVAISTLFPITVATAPLQWGFYTWLLLGMSIAGTYLVYKVRRLPLIFSFLGGFLVAGWIRMLIWEESVNTVFNDFMWGGLFVFTFHMITDPKTSPNGTRSQIYYGLGTAVIGQAMIQMQVPAALLMSLAFICFGRVLWRWGRTKGNQNVVKKKPSVS